MSRAQKLKWYADQLISDAVTDEQRKDNETAVSHYLQAADILLLLSKTEENYTVWRDYTDKAANCQKKARMLIALIPKDKTG